MSDAQRVRLVRELLEQVLAGRLTPEEGVTAIALVLDPGPLTYDQVALQVRLGVAHLGD